MAVPVFLRGRLRFLTNIHLWIIVAITLALTVLYHYWPWRGWTTSGPWSFPPFLVNLATLEIKYHVLGSLFLIPILYGVVLRWWLGTFLALLLSLAGLLPILPKSYGIENLITNISILFLPLAVFSIISLELKWRTRERRIFAEREKERQLFVSKVIEAQENEQQRIARELHDETIQTLSVIATYLENIPASNFDEKEISHIKDSVINVINGLRQISRDLRPPVLDRFGLVSALNQLINQTNKQCDTHFLLTVIGNEHKFIPKVEINIFRVLQEALNNTKNHSKATEAQVILEFDVNQLKITVQDNGRGFDMQRTMESVTTQNKLGLIGMRERINLINGTLQIRATPGQGTTLFIEVPYAIGIFV